MLTMMAVCHTVVPEHKDDQVRSLQEEFLKHMICAKYYVLLRITMHLFYTISVMFCSVLIVTNISRMNFLADSVSVFFSR